MGAADQPNDLGLDAADAVVLVLVDGLGLENLDESLAHARFLKSARAEARVIRTVLPSTTASALASLATGAVPGSHGLLGYRIREPETDELLNQLNELDRVSDLDSWLGMGTLATRANRVGISSTVVGLPRFTRSPFTRVVHAGADYVGAKSLAERVDLVISQLAAGVRFVMLYVPELDQRAHAHGWRTNAWTASLESLDAELARLRRSMPARVSLFVTADHGVIDVPQSAHRDVGDSRLPVTGVVDIGGEPRGLQLYLEPGVEPESLASEWANRLGEQAVVVTREAMVTSGWWAEGTSDVMRRAGEVLVFAAGNTVFFDARSPDAPARKMVGHHGSFSDAETLVPFIPLMA